MYGEFCARPPPATCMQYNKMLGEMGSLAMPPMSSPDPICY